MDTNGFLQKILTEFGISSFYLFNFKIYFEIKYFFLPSFQFKVERKKRKL